MKRLILFSVVALFAVVDAKAQNSALQTPDFLRHYQIVPRLSTLGITGGFAGVHERYRLSGEYDFHHSFRPTGAAFFENAEVWGSLISDHPTIAIVYDIDERLNLEGLKGEQLPVAAPFDVFKFTGETADGSDLTLLATMLGPWMYVRGHSIAPEGSADYFDYHLRMVARSRPFADLNDDGAVNAADFTLMRDRLANSPLGSGLADWHSQFGEHPPDFSAADAFMSAALGSTASAMAVPEPSSVGLALVCAILFARARVLHKAATAGRA